MPSSCKGRYRRVAVLEVPIGVETAIIRNSTNVRIVETWEGCNVGKTDRCAYAIALSEAEKLAEKLNA
jgi:hypothetical protein